MWSKLKTIFSSNGTSTAAKDKSSKAKTPGNSSAVSTSSPVVLSLGDIRRRSARISQHQNSSSMASKLAQDPNDPLTTISGMNDDLYQMDTLSYTNLRMILESKFGKGAHLSRSQMDKVKLLSADIAKEYKAFSDIVSRCIQYKLRESIGIAAPISPEPANIINHVEISVGDNKPSVHPLLEEKRDSSEAVLDMPIDDAVKNENHETGAVLSDGIKYLYFCQDLSLENEVGGEELSKEQSSAIKEGKDEDDFIILQKTTVYDTKDGDLSPNTLDDGKASRKISAADAQSSFDNQPLQRTETIIPPDNPSSSSVLDTEAEEEVLDSGSFVEKTDTLVAVEDEKERMDRYLKFITPQLEQAVTSFKIISESIEKLKKIIEDHKQNYVPPPVNQNSEYAVVQRLLVHPKYKEMVKGCGSGRTQYGIAYAGASEPGDLWMNNLLHCYLRECHGPQKEWTKLRNKPRPNQNGEPNGNNSILINQSLQFAADFNDDENSEIRRTADLLSMRAANSSVIDAIDIRDLINWMRFTHQQPETHSKRTIDVIEDAVEKMGGWNYFEVFLQNWLRHFYLEFGRSNLPFPLPGCRSWCQEVQITYDGKIDNLPGAVSVSDLFENSVDIAAVQKKKTSLKSPGIIERIRTADEAISFTEALSGLLNDPTHPDVRHWDFVVRSAYRELLQIHDVLDDEFTSSINVFNQWISAVRNSGLLEKGEYKDMGVATEALNDDSMTLKQKKMIHPDLVWIREKGIVINAYLRPERYAKIVKIEEDLRSILSSSRLNKKSFMGHVFRTSTSSMSSAASSKTDTADLTKSSKRTHRKSSSFGILESASKILHNKKNRASISELEVDDSTSISPQQVQTDSNQQQLEVVTTMSRKPRSFSAPVSPGPIRERVAIYLEIKEICTELNKRKPLIPAEMIKEAFKLSEIVVRYYLREELLAKYQAVY